MTPADWVLLAVAASLASGLTLWTMRRTRAAIRNWFNRAVLRAVHQFRVRLDRYKLVSKRAIRDELLRDNVVQHAIGEYRRQHGTTEMDVRVRVESYIEEIVPYFNVLTYYRFGYNVARVLVNLLYRVSSEYRDEAALNAIPRRDVVVYVMNHRSNADYVVVAYVLARQVSISYAVGEWARVWPLEYVFKSFGAYFVRRRYREPLYHTVLERYVQLITRNGVTQGIFIEGGLARNGAFRPPKLGLLDYMTRTILDAQFDRDIWLVPVALNYDRVLEDRSLILELLDPPVRHGRLKQLAGLVHYVGINLLRLVTGNLKRYGRVAVNFGTPLSLRSWLSGNPAVLELPKEERLPRLQALADELMERIAAVLPVTPVPLVAATVLSFAETVVRRADLLDRLDELRDHLIKTGAKLVQPQRTADAILDRGWRTLRMRRLVVREGDCYVVLPGQRPLLEYYANSIRHLLPEIERRVEMHPAREPDEDLPKLREWRKRDDGTTA
jgi:glycerol-3-phosphate O-acyltransferase